jgi:hypothetical protein
MNPITKFSALIVCLVTLIGCSNPTYTNQQQGFIPVGWQSIAVMPFAGDSRFTETSTQAFTIQVLNLPTFRVIQPSTVSISVRELGLVPTPTGFTVFEAQQIGKAVNADAVIYGTVTSYNSGATMNGFCTAQIVDVASGEIVGASHNPSGLLMGFSEHQCVMAAVERTGGQILKILNDLSRKNRPVPKQTSPSRKVDI